VHPIELLTDPLLVSVEVFTLTININHILSHLLEMHLSIDWFIRRMI
jgi:hypothetical protein